MLSNQIKPMKTHIFLLFTIGMLFVGMPVFSCTTFVYKTPDGKLYFGRNFDFPAGMGHIQINKRGVAKFSMPPQGEEVFEWTSLFGSISFNQNGREFPYGGMNEAGLIIEQMWHQEAQYPEKDARPGLTELQWIQYQLDRSATIEELIASDSALRISNASVATLHFLVADSTGAAAVIEFLDGKMRVYKEAELPYSALANCSYEVSLDYKNRKLNDSGAVFSGWTENSSGRFSKAAAMLSKNSPVDYAIDYCYAILDSVSQGNQTQWRIVYDQKASTIYYLSLEQPLMQKVSLNDFDFSCEQADLYIDMQAVNKEGSALAKFSADANYALINGVCEAVEFLSQLPGEYRKAVAAYPANFECNDIK